MLYLVYHQGVVIERIKKTVTEQANIADRVEYFPIITIKFTTRLNNKYIHPMKIHFIFNESINFYVLVIIWNKFSDFSI